MKLYKILIAFLITMVIKSACNDGCLKCTPENTCLLCDFILGYVIKDNQCNLQKSANCILQDINGKCLSCFPKHFYDSSQEVCVEVHTDGEIDFCQNYSNLQACLSCEPKYYISENSCSLASPEIAFCEYYLTNDICSSCQDGYLLSTDKKSCLEIQSSQNCFQYTDILCQSCSSNYLFDQNKYFYQFLSDIQTSNQNNLKNTIEFYSDQSGSYVEVCSSSSLPNCSEIANDLQCKSCSSGHYLEDGKCKKNPEEIIDFCIHYNTITDCQECAQGYYREAPIKCTRVDTKNNCHLYSQTADETLCTQCVSTHYLQSKNNCVERNVNPEHCEEFEISLNQCKECKTTYHLTNDRLNCLKEVKFCEQYEQNSQATEELECFQCQDGYYYDEDDEICLKGEIEFCKKYDRIQDQCIECQNTYYLTQERMCTPHNPITSCQDYDSFEVDHCKKCDGNSFLFVQKTYCEPVFIDHCDTYHSATQCEKCEVDYNLTSNYICEPMDSSLFNCEIAEFGNCLKCKSGLILHEKKCELPLPLVTENCFKDNIDGYNEVDDIKCEQCETNSVFYNYKNNFICYDTTNLAQFMDINLENHCTGYSLVNNQLVCIRCAQDYQLEDTYCVPECNSIYTLYRHEYFFNEDDSSKFKLNKINKCGHKIQNCSVAGVLSEQNDDDIEYGCVKCDDNSYKKTDISGSTVIGSNLDHEVIDNSNIFYQNEFECLSEQQDVKATSLNSDGWQDNCEYFYELISGELGCLRCKINYSGMIDDFKVDNCREYDGDECIICLPQYVLDGPYKCVQGAGIDHCQVYNFVTETLECYNCDDDYYLRTDKLGCIERSVIVDNCDVYYHDKELCKVCDANYWKNSEENVCYNEIENCLENIEPLIENADSTCNNCENGYYPSSSKTECIGGSVDNCWKYDQTQENVCVQWQDHIEILIKNQCVAPNQIENCVFYSDIDTCTQCDAGHHLDSNHCCEYGEYFNQFDQECLDIPLDNCMLYNAVTELCVQCNPGYNQDVYNVHFCCPDHQYWHSPFQDACVEQIEIFDENFQKCSVFDIIQWECIGCHDHQYLTNKECCDLGEFYSIENENCQPSPILDCLKYDSVTEKCLLCQTDPVFTLLESDTKCCEFPQYYDGVQCSDLPFPNCEAFDFDNNVCVQCEDTYYISDGYCCQDRDKRNGVTEACINPIGIDDCLQYHGGECILCDTTHNLQNNKQTCCLNNWSWNGYKCVDNDIFFQFCIELDLDTHLCTQCEDGYYLNYNQCVIEGNYIDPTDSYSEKVIESDYYGSPPVQTYCLQLIVVDGNPANDYCQKCSENRLLFNSHDCEECGTVYVNPNYYIIGKITQKCAFYDEDTFACTDCLQHTSGYFISDNLCCAYGEVKSTVNNLCEANTTKANCKESDTASNCVSCYDGFYIDATNNCVANDIVDCEDQADATTCTTCNPGFCWNDPSCDAVTVDNCADAIVDAGCSICIDCKDGYYLHNSQCCPYGYIHDGTKCKKGDQEYCAEYTLNDCAECFYNKDECTQFNNYNYEQILNLKQYGTTSTFPGKNTMTYLDNGACSLYNTYYDPQDKEYKNIPISNCQQYDRVAQLCLVCHQGYSIQEGGVACCKFNEDWDNFVCIVDNLKAECPALVDGNKMYLSNDKCCQEGTYYNTDSNQCETLFDPNCLKSKDNINCDQCADTFASNTYPATYEAIMKGGNCLYTRKKKLLYECINQTLVLVQKKGIDVERNLRDCKQVNVDNLECDECIPGYYLSKYLDQTPYCCEEGKVSYLNVCVSIETLIDHCVDFDYESRSCSACEAGYNDQYGMCCQDELYIDLNTMTCSILVANCEVFDYNFQECDQCEDGYYYHKQNCCAHGFMYDGGSCVEILGNGLDQCKKYNNEDVCIECETSNYLLNDHCCGYNYFWNVDTSACEQFSTEPLVDCKYIDVSFNCQECMNQNSHYIHHTHCCELGEFYDRFGYLNCQPIAGDGFVNCLKLNDDDKCIECDGGLYLTNGHCCNIKDYWSDDHGCLAISGTGYTHCQKINNALNECSECYENYYLSDKHCCQEEYWYNSGTSNCERITLDDECLQTDDDTACSLCSGSLYGNTCQCDLSTETYETDDTCVTPKISGCKITADGTTCQTCDEGYYLNNNICCQFGQKENGFGACITITLTNCLEVAAGICSRCDTTDQNLYPTNDYCCEEGFYGDTGNGCQPLTGQIDNCLKTLINDITVCEKCAENYYVTNDKCCLEHYMWDSGACVLIEEYLFNQDVNCAHYRNQICVECVDTANEYISNRFCCPIGQYHDEVSCVPIVNLDNCDKTNDDIDCLECTNQCDWANSGCALPAEVNWLFKGKCCPIGQVFSNVSSSCTAISNVVSDLNSASCQIINLDMNCVKCDSGSGHPDLIDDVCCPSGEVYNGITNVCQSAFTPAIANCVHKGLATECTACADGYYLDTSNLNCLENLIPNCKTQNTAANTCDTCDDTYYLYDDTTDSCCLDGFYGSDCSAITLPHCLQTQDDTTCTLCDEATSYLVTPNCCAYGTYWDTATSSCLPITIEPECIEASDATTCTGCTVATHYLTYSNCCTYNQYFENATNNQCDDISKAAHCNQYSDTGCITCIATYYLSSSVCCLDGYYYDGAACKEITLPNCLQSDDNITCKTCVATACNQSGCDIVNSCSCAAGEFYLKGGQCCEVGEYHNGTSCVSLTTHSTELLQNCWVLSESDRCIQCNTTGFDHLTDGSTIAGCCATNQKIDTTDNSCTGAYPMNNCLIGTSTVCTKCADGYYYNTTPECVINDFADCDVQFSSSVCTTCSAGKYLSNSVCCDEGTFGSACDPITIPNCNKSDDNSTCDECLASNYLTLGTCCAQGQSYDSVGFQCATITEFTNCLEINDAFTECTLCDSPTAYKSGNGCCVPGQYYDGTACLPITIANCDESQNDITCGKCSAGNYITNDHCCPDGEYWDTTFNTCLAIDIYAYCKEYDAGACVTCIDGYYISASTACCPYGQWYDGTSCKDITLLNCAKTDNGTACLECLNHCNPAEKTCVFGDNYLHTTQCCPIKEAYDTDACKPIVDLITTIGKDQCTVLNSTNECIQCEQGYNLFDQACCADGWIVDETNSECVLIEESPIEQCQIFSRDTEGCEQCGTGSYQYDLQTCVTNEMENCNVQQSCNICLECGTNTYYYSDLHMGMGACCANGTFGSCCDAITLPGCSQTQDDDTCDKCNTINNYYLTKGKCCQNGFYYDNIVANDCVTIDLANCTQTSNNVGCEACEAGYYISNNQCCSQGQYFNVSTLTCQPIEMNECIQTQNDNQCQVCNNGYYVSNHNCCEPKQFWSGGECLYIKYLVDYKCKTLDQTTGNCLECNENDKYYISDGQCCLLGSFWNATDKVCESFTGNLLNCLKSAVDDDTKCAMCSSSTYLTNDHCCQEQSFWNGTDSRCELILGTDCIQHDGTKCVDCGNNKYISGSDQCCTDYFYYDAATLKNCVPITIEFCSQSIDNTACVTCDNDKYASGSICCDHGYYDNSGTCAPITLNDCEESNDNATCSECESGYYLSDSNCCKIGYLWDSARSVCDEIAIIQDTQVNCIRYNGGICEECNKVTLLSNNNCCEFGQWYTGGACAAGASVIPNCISTADGAACLKCDDTKYLTNGQCCDVGSYHDGTECKEITLPNCVESDDNTACAKCDASKVLSLGNCCDFYNYFDSGSCRPIPGSKCTQGTDNVTCTGCSNDLYPSMPNICCPEETKGADCEDMTLFSCLRETTAAVCDKCMDNFDLINDKCCQNYLWHDATECRTTPQHCKTDDGAGNCTSCYGDEYFNGAGGCCLNGFYYDSATTACVAFPDNVCVKATVDNATCLECGDLDNYPVNGTNVCCPLGQKDGVNCIDIGINFCLKFLGGICTECGTGYYATNGICCPFGQYSNAGICEDIPLQMCLEYDGTECTNCRTNLYWSEESTSTTGLCCEYGLFYNDDTLDCKSIHSERNDALQNCSQYDTKCIGCDDTTYLTYDQCCPIRTVWDSTSNSCKDLEVTHNSHIYQCTEYDAGVCKACQFGFTLTATNYCAEENLEYCKVYDLQNQTCLECANPDQYITNNHCCDQGYYFETSRQTCIKIGSVNDLVCEKYEDGSCQDCNNGAYYITNGYCCLSSTYYLNDQCQDTIDLLGFDLCTQIIDNNVEEDAIDSIYTCGQCSTENYIHHNVCCGYLAFYNQVTNACDATVLINNCQQYNNQDLCKVCTNGYLTNGHCCLDNNYWDSTQCTAISTLSIGTCYQYSDEKCLECANDYEIIPTNDTCCDDTFYYSNADQMCKTIPTCTNGTFNFTTEVCDCNATYYSTGIHCCLSTEEWNGTACATIAVAENCVQKREDPSECILCSPTYQLRDHHCCIEEEFHFKGQCLTYSDYIGTTCLTMNELGQCQLCIDDMYPSNDVCCDEGKYFNSTNGTCEVLTGNCIKKNTDCFACETGYIFQQLDNTCDEDTTPLKCLVQDAAGICIECVDNYNLQDGHCCADGDTYFAVETNREFCKDLQQATQLCVRYDVDNFICHSEQCNDDHYISYSYCCMEEQQYDENASKVCIANDANLKANDFCIGYDQINDHCVLCLDDYYLAANTNCYEIFEGCLQVRLVNISTDNNNDDDDCSLCDTNYYLYEGVCCAYGKYSTAGNRTCIDIPIQNCEIYLPYDLQCQQCVVDFDLSENRIACCDNNEIYDHAIKGCVKTWPVEDVQCIVFDKLNIDCVVCEAGYYVSKGRCCLEGTMFVLGVCETIVSQFPLITNCAQYDQEDSKCVKCNVDFYLDVDNLCQSIPIADCLVYDWPTSMCQECDNSTFYIHKGHCCLDNQYYNGTACATIGAGENCVKYDNADICSECQSNHYLFNGTNCCAYGEEGNSCTAGTIQECQQYDNSGTCIKCNSGFASVHLFGNLNLCFEFAIGNCVDGEIHYDGDLKHDVLQCVNCTNEGTDFVQNPYNQTEQLPFPIDDIPNCRYHHILNKFNQSTFECEQCDDNVAQYTNGTICLNRTVNQNCGVYDPFADLCLECQTDFYFNAGTCTAIPIANCQIYDQGTMECTKCYFGYIYFPNANECIDVTLSPLEATPPNSYKGYIPECQEMTECSSNYYDGLSKTMNLLYSCHKCTNTSQIPFVSIRGSQTYTGYGGLQQLTLTGATYQESSEQNSNICVEPTAGNLNISISDFNFPSNCALGVINSNSNLNASDSTTSNPDLEQIAAFCTACLPGFKPQYIVQDVTPKVAYSCSSINNCSVSGNQINACQECITNFVFGYDFTNNKIDKSVCVSFSDNTCLSVDDRDATDKECVVCKKGYTLNYDNICEQIQPSFCTQDNFSFQNLFKISQLSDFIELYPEGIGCTECEANHVAIFETEDNHQCNISPYVTSASYINDTVYPTHCVYHTYINDQFPLCALCEDGYVVTTSMKCLPAVGNLTNCTEAQNDAICVACVDTHIAVNSLCEEKNIQNCTTFHNSHLKTTQECVQCNNSYYLSSPSVCDLGGIRNCSVYESMNKNVCIQCDSGYELIINIDDVYRCVAISSHVNCLSIDNDLLYEHVISCETCPKNMILKEYQYNKTVCNNIDFIENCIDYHIAETLDTSQFNCLECDKDFYLASDKQSCISRTLILSECEEYEIDSDLCKECEDGYILSTDQKECISNPSGVPGCGEYSAEDTCIGCFNDMYLTEDGFCKNVVGDKIDNCLTYSDNETCLSCSSTHVLEDKECVQIKAQNCLTLKNRFECESCSSGYIFKEEVDAEDDTLINCVVQDVINQCEIYSKTENKCDQCATNYYQNEELECIIVDIDNQIQNCKYMQDNSTCKQCITNFVLSSNKDKCLDYSLNTNCESLVQVSPTCQICKPGYKFIERSCQPVEGWEINQGCLVFNPLDETQCLICQSNYYQNEFGQCSHNSNYKNDTVIDNNNNTTNKTTSSVKIIYMMLFCYLLMFW